MYNYDPSLSANQSLANWQSAGSPTQSASGEAYSNLGIPMSAYANGYGGGTFSPYGDTSRMGGQASNNNTPVTPSLGLSNMFQGQQQQIPRVATDMSSSGGTFAAAPSPPQDPTTYNSSLPNNFGGARGGQQQGPNMWAGGGGGFNENTGQYYGTNPNGRLSGMGATSYSNAPNYYQSAGYNRRWGG